MKKWITLKKCKKLCSLVLSALLLMSAVPMSVFASAELPDVWTGYVELPAGTINGNVAASGNADIVLKGDVTINGVIFVHPNTHLTIRSHGDLIAVEDRATLTFGTASTEAVSIHVHENATLDFRSVNVITSPRAPFLRNEGALVATRETSIRYNAPQQYDSGIPLIYNTHGSFFGMDSNTQIHADKSTVVENEGGFRGDNSADYRVELKSNSNSAYIAGPNSTKNDLGAVYLINNSKIRPTLSVLSSKIIMNYTYIENQAKDGVAIFYGTQIHEPSIVKNQCTILGYEEGKMTLYTLDSNDDGLEENQKLETQSYRAGYPASALPTPSHPYYEFKGWSLTFDGEVLNNIPYESKKLYAKWNQNGYAKVNFLAGMAAGQMEPTYLKVGEKVTLPEPSFLPPDHMRFEHWSCNGKTYQPGDTVQVTENMHFTAEWIFSGKVKIQFDKGTNGIGSMPTQVFKVGEKIVLPQCSFQSTGYQWVFDGWKAADNTVYPAGTTVPVTATTTYTALWKELPQYTYKNQALLEDGLYIMEGDVGTAQVIEIKGNVVFLLKDGCNLTTNGVMVTKGNNLTVYSESNQKETMGKWKANGSYYTAAIGGANTMGNVTINGGHITTVSNDQNAGLGTASSSEGGTLTINGGYIDAKTSSKGAAIGVGNTTNNFLLTVNGGEIHAYADGDAAAIGGSGGSQENSKFKNTFVFNGGTIYAETVGDGAAIGTGYTEPNPTYFIFNGGEIHAVSKTTPAAIGSGAVKSENTYLTFNGGHIYAEKINDGYMAIGNSSRDNYYNHDSIHMDFKKGNTVIITNTPMGNAGHINVEGMLGLLSEDGGKTFTVRNRAVINEDFTLPADATLTIPKNTELRILDGATLTSSNPIQNHGYVTIEEGGTLNGSLVGNAAGNFETVLLTFSSGEAKLSSFYRLVLKNTEIALPLCPFQNGKQIFDCWNVNGARKASAQTQMAYDDMLITAEYSIDNNPKITNIQVLDQADGYSKNADWLFDGLTQLYHQRWSCSMSAEPYVVFELPEKKAVSRFVLHTYGGYRPEQLNFQVLKNEAAYYALSASAQKNYLRDKSNWQTVYEVTQENSGDVTEYACGFSFENRIYRLNILVGDSSNEINATELGVFGRNIAFADVTYEQGAGTGIMPKDSVIVGKPFTLPKCRFEKEHHSFVGWVLNHQGEPLAEKTNLDIHENITLTATYQENPKVSFDTLGGTAFAPMWSNLLNNGIVRIPQEAPTKPDWTFAGWTDGYGTYLPGDEYLVGDKNVTLRAIWKLLPILTAQPALQGFLNQPLKNVALTAFACNVPGTFYWLNENETLKSGTHTYFASFVPEDSTKYLTLSKIAVTITVKEYAMVSFSLAGGSGAMAPTMVEKNTDFILPTCDLMAPFGMHFVKWNLGEAGDAVTIRANTVLLPIWEEGLDILEVATTKQATCYMHSDGRLLVDASGYLPQLEMPFPSYQSSIFVLSIAEGVQNIGPNAFATFASMQYLRLPSTLKNLHTKALANTQVDTVLVLRGSKADDFVTEKQMKHTYLGEVTGDGVVDLADYDTVQKEIVGSGSSLSTEQKLLADCDGDGAIDAFDLALLDASSIA